MPAKLDRIKDEALRDSLATAQASLKSGNFGDVVHRSSDAYVEMLRRDPDLVKGPMGMRRILFYPRLSEAITYFEFAVDSLVREGV